MQDRKQRVSQTQKAHPDGCAFCVQREGGCSAVSGTRGNMEGMRGTAQVMLNMKNAPHRAHFSFSAGGDRWSSAKHKKRATWACFLCLAGRGGEGRHMCVSGIPVDGEVGGRGQAAGR